MSHRNGHDHPQLPLFGSVLPDGNGGFRCVPAKPAQEVGPRDAARLLGVAHSTLNNLIDHPEFSRVVKWRWLTPRRGKRVYDAESLANFRRATRDPEFNEQLSGSSAGKGDEKGQR